MSIIDRQRITAVQAMEALGYAFDGIRWQQQAADAAQAFAAEADALHALLVTRRGSLQGCAEGSPEDAELKMIAEIVTAYEVKRWPDGKVPDGKG